MNTQTQFKSRDLPALPWQDAINEVLGLKAFRSIDGIREVFLRMTVSRSPACSKFTAKLKICSRRR